jgi:hypothetical protein
MLNRLADLATKCRSAVCAIHPLTGSVIVTPFPLNVRAMNVLAANVLLANVLKLMTRSHSCGFRMNQPLLSALRMAQQILLSMFQHR